MQDSWFRLHVDILDNPKVDGLPAELYKIWVKTIAVAKRHKGALPPVTRYAFEMRLSVTEALRALRALLEANLIDQNSNSDSEEIRYAMHDWKFWQFEGLTSDKQKTSAAIRQQRYRNAHRNAGVTETVTEGVTRNVVKASQKRYVTGTRARTDSDSDSDSDYTLPPVTQAVTVSHQNESTEEKELQTFTPIDRAVTEAARAIHSRHPPIRRCGIGEVEKQLRTIVGKLPSEDRIRKLITINRTHEAWCACWEWQKDGGQFAKGLDNWLAPTKARFDQQPAPQDGPKRSERRVASKTERAMEIYMAMKGDEK